MIPKHRKVWKVQHNAKLQESLLLSYCSCPVAPISHTCYTKMHFRDVFITILYNHAQWSQYLLGTYFRKLHSASSLKESYPGLHCPHTWGMVFLFEISSVALFLNVSFKMYFRDREKEG